MNDEILEHKKLRSDATWNTLTSEQRETIEHWLFEDNLSYREIHQRAQSELGIAYSKSALARLHQHLLSRRAFQEIDALQEDTADLATPGANLAGLRSASKQLIATRLLQKTMQHADTKELYALGRLMLESEDREIQRDRAALARERFQFKASQAALKILPMLDEMNQEQEALEMARLHRIKLKLFGSKLLAKIELPDEPPSNPPIGNRKS